MKPASVNTSRKSVVQLVKALLVNDMIAFHWHTRLCCYDTQFCAIEHGYVAMEHGYVAMEHGCVAMEHGCVAIKHNYVATEHGCVATVHGFVAMEHSFVAMEHGCCLTTAHRCIAPLTHASTSNTLFGCTQQSYNRHTTHSYSNKSIWFHPKPATTLQHTHSLVKCHTHNT